MDEGNPGLIVRPMIKAVGPISVTASWRYAKPYIGRRIRIRNQFLSLMAWMEDYYRGMLVSMMEEHGARNSGEDMARNVWGTGILERP